MNDGAVLVYGLSRSGRAAVKLLASQGLKVFVYDDNADALSGFSGEAEVLSGGLQDLSGYSIIQVIMSPGIPPSAGGFQFLEAQGLEMISEIELAFRSCNSKCVVVTGTNGKSSTATLINQFFAECGLDSELVGNIGIPFSQVVAGRQKAPDWYVIEASSYQLELSPTLHPMVAVYTNYAPDHLEWHGTEEAYVEAKATVALRLCDDDFIVYPVGDSPLSKAVEQSKAKAISLGSPGSGAQLVLDAKTGRASSRGNWEIYIDEVANDLSYSWRLVSCALHCCLGLSEAFSMSHEKVLGALRKFKPLEHRLEEVGFIGHVRFINDSKATNIDSTQYALRMCKGPLVLILGGRHKGLSYKELIPFLCGRVKIVVALGEASDKIVRDLKASVPVVVADDFEAALSKAFDEALRMTLPSGGQCPTVLFSPACSSFDMFRDFEERGRSFKEWVRERQSK